MASVNAIKYDIESLTKKLCNGWTVLFPSIVAEEDDDEYDHDFKQLYANAIAKNEYLLVNKAKKFSKTGPTVGYWRKVINASECDETQELHDFVMGNNRCDDLMFKLEVVGERTIAIS